MAKVMWVVVLALVAAGAFAAESPAPEQDEAVTELKRHYSWGEWGGLTRLPYVQVSDLTFSREDFAAFGSGIEMRWADAESRSIYILDDGGRATAAIHLGVWPTVAEAHDRLIRLAVMLPHMAYYLARRGSTWDIGDACMYGKGGRPLMPESPGDSMIQGVIFSRNNVTVRLFAQPGDVRRLATVVDERIVQTAGGRPAEAMPAPESYDKSLLGILERRYDWDYWRHVVHKPGKVLALRFAEADFTGFGEGVRFHANAYNNAFVCPIYVMDGEGRPLASAQVVMLDSPQDAKERLLYLTLSKPGRTFAVAGLEGADGIGDVALVAVAGGAGAPEGALSCVLFARNNVLVSIDDVAPGFDAIALARLIDARLLNCLSAPPPGFVTR
jgi:hypothetical protein